MKTAKEVREILRENGIKSREVSVRTSTGAGAGTIIISPTVKGVDLKIKTILGLVTPSDRLKNNNYFYQCLNSLMD